MEQNISKFEEVFSYLYFLMLSADNIADPAELKFGTKILEIEKIDQKSTMKKIDFLGTLPRETVFENARKILKGLERNDQLKCLAYIKLIAKTDGDLDTSEIDLINNLTNNEIAISMKEISEMERKLKEQID